MTHEQWLEHVRVHPVVNIGQLEARTVAALNRMTKRGELLKTRGCFDTLCEFGTGPHKIIWWPSTSP